LRPDRRDVHEDGSISIRDNGRGIPVDAHPQYKIPGVEMVLTTLHSGGKYGQGGYKFYGGTGIAVGMATNMPPHNLGEIIDGIAALIRVLSKTDENREDTTWTQPGYVFFATRQDSSGRRVLDDHQRGGGVVTNRPLQIAIVPGARISWFASNNVPYQVQWAADSNPDTAWNNLGGLTIGNGSSNAVFDAAGPPHNVYRVLSIQ
jgi:hypothetical protein